MPKDIIQKLKDSGITGRSGSGFPVWQKWQMVAGPLASQKYIICNGSEGEPMIFKDGYILEKYSQEVINGIKIALKTIDNSSAYIYLNKDYYARFSQTLKSIIGNLPIILFEKPNGYIAGEETTLLNVIEGKQAEPRVKPPYPTQVGLWGKPTLVNNVETFYWVSKIFKDEYSGNRFYSIEGDVPNKGVVELPENYTVKQILEKTDNVPLFPYFAQVGGGACGEILLPEELDQPIKGAGSVIVFNKETTNVLDLMKNWADFYVSQNCDKCAPCREGLFRVKELLYQNNLDQKILNDIFDVLQKTAFCPLGRLAATPFKSAIAKLL